MRKVEDLLVRREKLRPIHRWRHERPAPEAQVIPDPQPIGQPLALEQDFQQVDQHRGVELGHLAHPVAIQRHPHQQVLVPAHRRHLIERPHHAAGHEALVAGAFRGQRPIAVEVDPPLVSALVEQAGADVLFPIAPLLDRKIDMLRRARPMPVPAQQGAVAVAHQLDRFRLLHHLLARIHIGDQIDGAIVPRRDLAPGPPHIKPEMVADHLWPGEVALVRPTLRRLAPEHLEQADAIHRLMLQNPGKAFFAAHFHGASPASLEGLTRRVCR